MDPVGSISSTWTMSSHRKNMWPLAFICFASFKTRSCFHLAHWKYQQTHPTKNAQKQNTATKSTLQRLKKVKRLGAGHRHSLPRQHQMVGWVQRLLLFPRGTGVLLSPIAWNCAIAPHGFFIWPFFIECHNFVFPLFFSSILSFRFELSSFHATINVTYHFNGVYLEHDWCKNRWSSRAPNEPIVGFFFPEERIPEHLMLLSAGGYAPVPQGWRRWDFRT